ncbi:MAG: RiPP maturation radical SAM protein 1 [Thermoleophilia bacterium]|nr:RiPP maturation radical SAM protein 1 [Thermoleophilia bacterium]
MTESAAPGTADAERGTGSQQRIALVNMPFAGAERPSIQCGLLKAVLARRGHRAAVLYLNLELAVELGHELYAALAELRSDQLLGEWLFSVAAFGPRDDEQAYLDAHPSVAQTCERLGYEFDDLRRLRNERLPAVIDRWAAEIDWGAYSIVGFSSTFEQNAASLALARRVKERFPEVAIVFGGANYDGEMGPEYVRAFAWIDYAVVGEGDEVLPELVARIAARNGAANLRGVVARVDGRVVDNGPAPLVRDLDALPDPDYDDFFAALRRLGRERVLGRAEPLIVFESARGCWWGEKHHCTFCGLNALGMAYRSKSPQRVHEELRRQSARYQIPTFEAVDNILDMRYLEDVCRALIAERCDYRIFYEVKANLRREQLRTLARAGITVIQPGIESLSTHVLGLMRKGSTMLLNVRLLKWAQYFGMTVAWNLLTGFAGETREDYAEQARLMPLLVHLQPPSGGGPIWLERFSPYYTDSSFPVEDVRPWSAYGFVYPQGSVDLEKIAYFFSYRMRETVPAETLGDFFGAMDRWQDLWRQRRRPVLVYQRTPDWIQVVDRRDPETPAVHAFQGVAAAAYELCGDTFHSAARVAAVLSDGGAAVGRGEVEEALERFCELGLMVTEDGNYLSLALPVNPNW